MFMRGKRRRWENWRWCLGALQTAGQTPVSESSDDLRVGELVVAVANPFGFMGVATSGIVHAIGRRPGLGPTKWIQAEVQLVPGNSGATMILTNIRSIRVNQQTWKGANHKSLCPSRSQT